MYTVGSCNATGQQMTCQTCQCEQLTRHYFTCMTRHLCSPALNPYRKDGPDLRWPTWVDGANSFGDDIHRVVGVKREEVLSETLIPGE